MKPSSKRQWLHWVALAALVAVFVTLAVLQYHWSQAIAQAASVRMRTNLQISINGFREDLDRELSTVAMVFQTEPGASSGDRLNTYVQRFQSWERTAAHPKVVSAVYVTQGRPKVAPLLQLTSSGFVPVQWPERLTALRDAIPDFHGLTRRRSEQRDHLDHRGRHEHSAVVFGIFAPGPPWFVDEDVPALIGRIGGGDDGPDRAGWVVVVLDRDVLSGDVLKELADRHFAGTGGLEYRVAVINGADPSNVLFTTDSGFGSDDRARIDASEPLFGPFGVPAVRRMQGERIVAKPTVAGEQRFVRLPWMVRFETLRHGAPLSGWQLIVQHRHGSLEAAVHTMQIRNMAFGLGVLAVLAITTGLLWVNSRRAHRLAQLQMDFVAAVSHELRTPLAVISSAADNIADGVVDSRQQYVRYGRVIKAQAKQLIELVEQVLMFAATHKQRAPLHLRVSGVDEVVKTAIRNTSDTVAAAGFHLDYTPDPQVPPVMADPIALAHVLQNLISNAVKYGGDAKWIGIRAESAPSTDGLCARIHVSDGGTGIPDSELARIFEPFYRGEAAEAAQIHGTGLGLAVARAATEAMGGKLSVKSTPGAGSTFTVMLRGAADAGREAKASEQATALPAGGGN